MWMMAPQKIVCFNRRFIAACGTWCRYTSSTEQKQLENGRRCVEAFLLSGKYSTSLSEVLLTWAASSVESNAALCKGNRSVPKSSVMLRLHQAAEHGSWWLGNTTMWHEELLGCRMASKLVSMKHMHHAAHWACWAHRLFRGCVSWKMSLLRTVLHLMQGWAAIVWFACIFFTKASAPRLQPADLIL